MSPRPDPLPRLHRWRSNVIQAPFFFLATGFFGTLALLASLVAKTGRTQHRIARVWARACVRALRIAAHHSRRRRTFASTRSPCTPPTTPPTWIRRWSFRLFRFSSGSSPRRSSGPCPFIGWYLNRSGPDPDRYGEPAGDAVQPRWRRESASGRNAAVCVSRGIQNAKWRSCRRFWRGRPFWRFGRRFPWSRSHSAGVYDLLPIHTRHFYPGELVLTAGEPIDTTGMTMRQADELTARLRSAICGNARPSSRIRFRRDAGRRQSSPSTESVCVGPDRLLTLTAYPCTLSSMSLHIAIPEPTSKDTAYNQRALPQYIAAIQSAGALAQRWFRCMSDRIAWLACLPVFRAYCFPAAATTSIRRRTAKRGFRPATIPIPTGPLSTNCFLQDAFNLRKPILAICYGVQALNVWRNGSLIQDLQQTERPR